MLVGRDGVQRIRFGNSKELQLLKSFDEYFDVVRPSRTQQSWVSKLRRFAEGRKTDLSKIPVALDFCTPFQQRVLMQCRKIPFGKTLSYGELASQTSAPRAARAVGTAMKKNRCPLVIPCHRVVSSSGIGGYSAADGVSIKRRLLALEGVVV